MISRKRLVKVETALTPKQAVLLWLTEARHPGSPAEDQTNLAKLPLSEFPRSRINRQVAIAVRAAMKGQPEDLIAKAVRSAAMEADFLMMVALTVNQEIYSDAECRRLGLELLQEQVRYRGKDWTETKRRGWIQTFLGIAVEVLTLKGVVQQVEHEFFSGNVVLLRGAAEALDEGFGLINQVGITYNEVVAECPNAPPIDLAPCSKLVKPLIRFRVMQLADRARSEMLSEFVGHEAAVAVMRPYWSGENQQRALEQWQAEKGTPQAST